MELSALIQQLINQQAFNRLVNDPFANSGDVDGPFLGAQLLPERTVYENKYTQAGIRYKTVVAPHGTRYSKPQKRGAAITGEFEVELGYSDIAAELTAKMWDDIVALMRRAYGVNGLGAVRGSGVVNPSVQAVASLMDWARHGLSAPLAVRNEVDRWKCIVNAQVQMRGDGGYSEDVDYPNPDGHRVNAGGTWSNNTYDIMVDIVSMANFLKAKGYAIKWIITGTPVMTIMLNNDKLKARAGYLSVADGVITGIPARMTEEDITTLLRKNGLPPITLYDKQYYTEVAGAESVTVSGVTYTGNWYLDRAAMVFVCATPSNEIMNFGDMEPVILANTLGYLGVGTPAGALSPGVQIEIKVKDDLKNKGLDGAAWQATLPVLENPEAIGVIKNIG